MCESSELCIRQNVIPLILNFDWHCDLKIPGYDDRYSSNDLYGGARLYVGHLSSRTREHDLEHLFSKYGSLF
ncbi:hypothetical protein F2Q70_00028537 [Brassica cretica]|uniref:RRM domain-containing protein n=1 Tax=Brassica cretica TaxID=69181 RepID=A0A8S9L7L5_BRACR|nr:hypothetical protein F2Q70_00028537 [Brassica cretica]